MVVHYLLVQGLTANGRSEKDIDFKGLPTDAAAAAFASGKVDGVAVFAPFTLEALKRKGSHVLFGSKDFPGTIPDHIVFIDSAVAGRAADIQKVVNQDLLIDQVEPESPRVSQGEVPTKPDAIHRDPERMGTLHAAFARPSARSCITGLRR